MHTSSCVSQYSNKSAGCQQTVKYYMKQKSSADNQPNKFLIKQCV